MGNLVLITGATGGIGKAISQKLAEAGYDLHLTYRSSEEAAQKLASELSNKGVGVMISRLDLADKKAVADFSEEIKSNDKVYYAVVNNAGVTKDSLLMRAKLEEFDLVVDTNLRSSFSLIQALTRKMMKAKKGRIINISSVVASSGNPGQANYCASKGGLEAMTRSVALELATRGITANSIAPGFIETSMTDKLNEKQSEAMLSKIPMGRVGQPKEIAEAVNFLLSDGASYITGQTLHINGGLLLS